MTNPASVVVRAPSSPEGAEFRSEDIWVYERVYARVPLRESVCIGGAGRHGPRFRAEVPGVWDARHRFKHMDHVLPNP